MVRTTESAVREIGDFSASLTLTPFIETASNLVDKVEECDTDGKNDDDDLELIERWLAAHFAAITNPQLTSKSLGSASSSFQKGTVGESLRATLFGQQALALDTSGCLDGFGKTKAKTGWLGTSVRKNRKHEDIYDA